jgi:hypothetical protein
MDCAKSAIYARRTTVSVIEPREHEYENGMNKERWVVLRLESNERARLRRTKRDDYDINTGEKQTQMR